MAQFLFATMPIPGHVAPIAPVVESLLARGHQATRAFTAFGQPPGHEEVVEALAARRGSGRPQRLDRPLDREPRARDRGDPRGRRPTDRIEHDQQFHQVLVDRGLHRLDHEDIGAAHILFELDARLAVLEAADDRPAEREPEMAEADPDRPKRRGWWSGNR